MPNPGDPSLDDAVKEVFEAVERLPERVDHAAHERLAARHLEHAPGAPQQVWLHWIAALALLRVMPPGRLRVVVGAYRARVLMGPATSRAPPMISSGR